MLVEPALVVAAEFLVGGVDIVGLAPAAHRDVGGFAGQSCGAVQQGDVDGDALRAVAGHGVGVVEAVGCPGCGHRDLLAFPCRQGQLPGPRVQRDDFRAGAVEDLPAVVVARDDDVVAGRVSAGALLVAHLDLGVAEHPVHAELAADGVVDGSHVGVADGKDKDILVGGLGSGEEVVGGEPVEEQVAVGSEADPVVVGVGV